MLEYSKIEVLFLDLMQNKKHSTKSNILLDLTLVCGLVSRQNKH